MGFRKRLFRDMNGATMILGGRHVGLPVANLGQSLAFYRDLLGFAVASDEWEEGPFLETILRTPGAKAHIAKLKMPGPASAHPWMLELLEYQSPTPGPSPKLAIHTVGHAHLALTVDDLEATYRQLLRAGVAFLSAPAVSPSGRAKVAFCEDPDGYRLELVEVLPSP